MNLAFIVACWHLATSNLDGTIYILRLAERGVSRHGSVR
jgi:hypothetical protein